jgi:hypothetical protein
VRFEPTPSLYSETILWLSVSVKWFDRSEFEPSLRHKKGTYKGISVNDCPHQSRICARQTILGQDQASAQCTMGTNYIFLLSCWFQNHLLWTIFCVCQPSIKIWIGWYLLCMELAANLAWKLHLKPGYNWARKQARKRKHWSMWFGRARVNHIVSHEWITWCHGK